MFNKFNILGNIRSCICKIYSSIYARNYRKSKHRCITFVVTITSIVFVVDVITSIVKVKNIKPALERIEELNNEIKEKLAEIKSIRNEKSTEKSDIADNIQKIIDELNEKRK